MFPFFSLSFHISLSQVHNYFAALPIHYALSSCFFFLFPAIFFINSFRAEAYIMKLFFDILFLTDYELQIIQADFGTDTTKETYNLLLKTGFMKTAY